MTEPIKPSDLSERKPDYVIRAFNDLIEKHYSNGVATVFQVDALKLIKEYAAQHTTGVGAGNPDALTHQMILARGWLDVEAIYRNVGWYVEYHRAVQSEQPFEPFFVFSKP